MTDGAEMRLFPPPSGASADNGRCLIGLGAAADSRPCEGYLVGAAAGLKKRPLLEPADQSNLTNNQ